MKFTAFALDVYGQLHSDAIQIVQGIATFAAVNLGVDYKVVLKRFKTQIQVALAKQVSQMIHVRG